MIVEQLYTGCLAQGAYYIESEGEAAIIDPLREVTSYLRKAEKAGAKIKYIFETHFHADFVSGHLDLANKTGATIVYGPNANTSYEVHQATDGEVFKLGNVWIKVLHTPGHTLESATYLLIDENGKDKAIFTGDTLFIGDVGRPDLAIKGNVTERDLADVVLEDAGEEPRLLEVDDRGDHRLRGDRLADDHAAHAAPGGRDSGEFAWHECAAFAHGGLRRIDRNEHTLDHGARASGRCP